MPRLLMIALLAAGSALSLSTQAQVRGGMGGGRGGAVGHGGGAVGHGPVASGRAAPAMSGARFTGTPGSSRVIANGGRFGVHNRPPFFNNRFNNRGCFGAFPCRNRFFFNTGFGFPSWGYPYIPGFYPSDYFQEPQAQQPVVASNEEGGNTQLAVEIQRLSDEIDYMRQEQSRQAQARQPGVSLSARSAASTTFVFRDGHRMSTENYAIAGQTLWVFNERVAKKFPLSDLDRNATEQVNADNGVDVRLPEPAP
jgi:hypothetical protein